MKNLLRVTIGLICLLAVLYIPAPEPAVSAGNSALPFVWNQDSVWTALEGSFVDSRTSSCDDVTVSAASDLAAVDDALDLLDRAVVGPSDSLWVEIEDHLFGAGSKVAACGRLVDSFVETSNRVRQSAKRQSVDWDLGNTDARARLYRLLYGGRAAVEEVLAQNPDTAFALIRGVDEPSEAPSAVIHGVRIHSGDLLVSRGGYPTSALISRGSDYPGNFSHVALAHVSESGNVSVVEAHIESGVAATSAAQYLLDKKLRLMVLRMRADHPAIVQDPMLPRKAAQYAFLRATGEHVPYDFAMDYHDPSKLFCSEVASDAYAQFGVTLWTGISTISTLGLRTWLSSFGVRHFETQEPSDLEYDPQLVVVAEWRDPETLRMDRIDNAVVDAMLETAEAGERLEFAWYRLGPARLAKGYSVIRNLSGRIGPVPEGMSSASALRNQAYTQRHNELSGIVETRLDSIAAAKGYEPPYWRIVEVAREVVAAD